MRACVRAGLKDGVAVSPEDATLLVDIVHGGLGASKELVVSCIEGREQRAAAYAV